MGEQLVDSTLVGDAWTEEARRPRAAAQTGLITKSPHNLPYAALRGCVPAQAGGSSSGGERAAALRLVNGPLSGRPLHLGLVHPRLRLDGPALDRETASPRQDQHENR